MTSTVLVLLATGYFCAMMAVCLRLGLDPKTISMGLWLFGGVAIGMAFFLALAGGKP